MIRDYSRFLASGTQDAGAHGPRSTIDSLGWQPFFAQQTDVDEMSACPPVRVVAVQRSGLRVVGNDLDQKLPPRVDATVGDWILFDPTQPASSRVLERKSVIKRRAPGTDLAVQLIAANIDTTFIVSSCNADFNVARLERFIALALDAEITPVIVLTKADLTTDAAEYLEKARAISDQVSVVTLDARGAEPREQLGQWCTPGKTVAFLGSSGVGKSTLTNALAGNETIETQAVRENDAKGRHTTTSRNLHLVPGGCIVLDTPGMRELQLTDAAAGIGDLFGDLSSLATQCKFNDCQHDTEPGCAVRAALAKGEIDAARLGRWRKLIAEDAFNSASLSERRIRNKAFGKMIRQSLKQKNRKP